MIAEPEPAPALMVVLGATGVGKSEFALRIAERLGGEIVGCDALQIYRGFDAATAKPTPADRRRVPHHLVDCHDPRNDASLADYVRLADQAIGAIGARRRLPLIVGGSGLYLRGLLRGVIEAPPRDPKLRARLRRIARRGGEGRLRGLLERVDPVSAARIAPGDLQRTIRAIELARTEGGSWSARLSRSGTWGSTEERYLSLKIGLYPGRERLMESLDRRVDGFFENGLVREVQQLLGAGIPPEANAFRAIGYREVLGAILRDEDPDAVREEVKRKTRRYAKRQRTWFRAEPGVHWLDSSEEPERLVDRGVELWRQTISGRRR